VLAAFFVPESRAPRPRRPDVVGQVLVMLVLATLTYAIIEAPNSGWVSAQTLLLFAVALVAVGVLARHELRRADPLIDPRFFRSVPFSSATLIAVCGFGAYSGFLFLNTLYLQDVRGLSPLDAGLCTLPMAVVTILFAPLSGRIVGTRGPRLPLLVAGLTMAVAGVMLHQCGATTSLVWVVTAYTVFAIGFGMLNAPITNTAVSGMPNSQAGVAAAVASTSRQVGASLGVALSGSVLNSGLVGSMHSGFVPAARPAWLLLAGLSVAVFALGLFSSSRRAVRTVSRTAALFEADATAAAAFVPDSPRVR
jgi:predicted MFS family arabinose efflux permease